MNWKNEATQKLKRYPYMRQCLSSIPMDLERLELESQQLHSSGFQQITIAGRDVRHKEDALLGNLMYRQELELALQQASLWVRNVEQALGMLDPIAKDLLLSLYGTEEPPSIPQLCQQLNMERSAFYRKREAALEAFTLALYGSLDS